jgi:putative transposase
MSHVKIRVHLVFTIKNRDPLLTKEIRSNVHAHIAKNCREKEIYLKAVNGYSEHVHCLISVGKDQCISKIAQLIKGESSFWINKNNMTRSKFAWQDDYWAVSIGEPQVERVLNYIQNQEAHHSKKLFDKEVEEFMQKYGWNLVAE